VERLSINLRWSWDKPTQDLFAAIDPELWPQVGYDPLALLGEVSPARLDELADAESFVTRLDALTAELHNYLHRPLWYQQKAAEGAELPNGIAYFSMEFGVAGVLPNYSGGLGILAGDHLKSASDLGLPLVAVGLYYRSGYFRQSLTADGWQKENYPSPDPQGLPLRLLTNHEGDPILVELAMRLHQLRARWSRRWVEFLCSCCSDIPENGRLRGLPAPVQGDQVHRSDRNRPSAGAGDPGVTEIEVADARFP
jgi:starch phosphorylase